MHFPFPAESRFCGLLNTTTPTGKAFTKASFVALEADGAQIEY